MVGRLLRLAGVCLGLMLLAVSLPLYAQTSSEAEVATQDTNSREASVTCKLAQTRLNDYLMNLEQFKTSQLGANRSTLAFVNNISLRLEHNDQVENNKLLDDVKRLNQLVTDQEVAYTQLQSSLRTAVSVSCVSSDDVEELRSDVSDIRDVVQEINKLQIEYDDYISNTVLTNLKDVKTEINEDLNSKEANT